MAEVHVNGVRIHYELRGEGDPVLMLPGSGMKAETYDLTQTPAFLEAGHTCVLADPRGTDPSECPVSHYTVQEMATDMAHLIEELGVDPVHLFGHSLGSWVGQELALAFPHLVRSAVLCGTLANRGAFEDALSKAYTEVLESGQAFPTRYLACVLMTQIYTASELADDDLVPLVIEAISGDVHDDLQQWKAVDAYRDRLEVLAGITVPCRIIGFEHDILCPAHLGRELAAEIRGADYVEVAGVAHAGPMSAPEVVNPLALDWFSRH